MVVVLSAITLAPLLTGTNTFPERAVSSRASLRERRPVLSMYCLLQLVLHDAVKYRCRIFIW